MVPTLEVGDLVIVQSVPFSSLHVGDVVVFEEPYQNSLCSSVDIVHRIVEIANGTIYTQGDNRLTNPRPDEPDSWPPVPADCIKGQVMFALPYLGQISQAFPPPLNYILVAIIIVIVFLMEVASSRQKQEEEPAEAAPKTAP